MAATLDDTLNAEDLLALAMETGKYGVAGMAMLDKANTDAYGNPEITQVNIGAGTNPGILVSGHDLRDLEMLLEQTRGTGIDIYTHSEMLPAHYYPAFKKYPHFVGNYGNAWWKQKEEFEAFHGPILMTTNCIVPPKDSYKDRLYTTGAAGFPGCTHIPGEIGEQKDFSVIIEHAKNVRLRMSWKQAQLPAVLLMRRFWLWQIRLWKLLKAAPSKSLLSWQAVTDALKVVNTILNLPGRCRKIP